jgi:hypothetical protein
VPARLQRRRLLEPPRLWRHDLVEAACPAVPAPPKPEEQTHAQCDLRLHGHHVVESVEKPVVLQGPACYKSSSSTSTVKPAMMRVRVRLAMVSVHSPTPAQTLPSASDLLDLRA